MATVPTFRNVSTIIGEDGIERVTDFQLIECSLVLPPPSETPPEPEQPRSVCPYCGTTNVSVLDGHMACYECGVEATFGITVEADDWSDVMEQLSQTAEPGLVMTHGYPDISDYTNPCGEIPIAPIKNYEDIVGDIRDRFEILDL